MLRFKFSKRYFIPAVVLFGIEVLIAAYMHDDFIRPYFGDFLVVILLYCFIRSFVDTRVLPTAIAVLLFSYLLEVLQYVNITHYIGLKGSEWAHLLIGSVFQWGDIVAYTAGILTVVIIENLWTGVTVSNGPIN